MGLGFADQHVFVASLGSLLFGYSISCLNTLEKVMPSAFEWCGNAQTIECPAAKYNFSILSTLVFIFAALGSFVAGPYSTLGRRLMHITLHILFIIGGSFLAFANVLWALIIGRAFQGFAVGLVTVASPMYISEISPLHSRGSRGVIHQLFITLGILVGIGLGVALRNFDPLKGVSTFERIYMKFLLGFPALVSIVAIILFVNCFSTETPQFLVKQQRPSDARAVLQKIYNTEDVDDQMKDLSSSQESTDEGKGNTGCMSSFRLAFGDRWFASAILIGCVLASSQQITGINTFVAASNSIFSDAGMSPQTVSIASTIMAFANTVMTFPAIYAVEKFGRKTLLLIGALGQFVTLSILPVCELLVKFNVLDASKLGIAACVSVVGFIIFFALALGPVVWVVLNEMFPPEIQSIGTGLASGINWVTGIFVVFITTSVLNDKKYLLAKFIFFATTSGIAALFIGAFVKETKGRSNANSPFMDGRLKKDDVQTPLIITSEA